MLRRSLTFLDKSMFAAKRRVINPVHPNPSTPGHFIRAAFTTDPMKESDRARFTSGGEAMREVLDAPENLEGDRSRKALMMRGDKEFEALADFIRGAEFDQMISGRRFQKVYEAMTENDDVFIWLCMVSMSVLNPGDMRSRLIYRHLEALAHAVASGEMQQRTAFRFFETAVRSPAYREIAKRQLEGGAATRLAGISAAAEVVRRLGVSRRPMTSYFQLFQRISERSEAMTPWGFPPLFQFEERLQLENRLKFFSRDLKRVQRRRRSASMFSRFTTMMGPRIMWAPPTWRHTKRYMGPQFTAYPGLVPD